MGKELSWIVEIKTMAVDEIDRGEKQEKEQKYS